MPHFAHEVIDKGFDMLSFDKEMFLLMAQLFVIVDVFLVAVSLARKVLDILTGGLVVVTLIMMGIGIGLMVMDTLYGNDTKTQQHKQTYVNLLKLALAKLLGKYNELKYLKGEL